MHLNIRGKSYHVEIHQHREDLPILVMLHGFMGSGSAFSHLMADLKMFVNPVTVDLLGHGFTDGDTHPGRFSVDEQITDLNAVIQSFHSDPVILHGYSMGGRLALHYALAHPDAISGLILECSAYGITDFRERADRQNVDEKRAQAIEADYKNFLEDWIRLPLFNSGKRVSNALVERYSTMQHNQQPAFMANSLRGFGSGTMPSAEHMLDKLELPALILAGESDEKYRTIAAEMDQIIPNSRVKIIKNTGHRVHLENPEAFVSEVKFFIENMPDL